jgi:hypothetical protein
VDFKGKRAPIFEAHAVTNLLGRAVIRHYLADMLASFTKTSSGVYPGAMGPEHAQRSLFEGAT